MTNTGSNSLDREAVKEVLQEMSVAMDIIREQRTVIKDLVDAGSETHGLNKRQLRKIAKVFHDNSFAETKGDYEDFDTLYRDIFRL